MSSSVECDIETRLDEISKENSMLRFINEMILEDPTPDIRPVLDSTGPLKRRIKELEVFLFNLGTENQALQKSVADTSRQLQMAKERVRVETTAAQVLRSKVEFLGRRVSENDQLEDNLKSTEKKLAVSRKTVVNLGKENASYKTDLDALRVAFEKVTEESKCVMYQNCQLSATLQLNVMEQARLQQLLEATTCSLTELRHMPSCRDIAVQTEFCIMHTFVQTAAHDGIEAIVQTLAIAVVNASVQPTKGIVTQTFVQTVLATADAFVQTVCEYGDLLTMLTCASCKCVSATHTLFPCGHGSCESCFSQQVVADVRLGGVLCGECADGLPVTRVCPNIVLLKLHALLLPNSM